MKLVHCKADWPNEIRITDPSNGSELKIGFWRTVRIPEDGTVYNLPAGLGRFPLLEASQFQDKLSPNGLKNIDCVFPMYDREAMYMEFIASKYNFSPGRIQSPYAIRPYVGGVNAISGKTVQEQSSSMSLTDPEVRVKMRVEGKGMDTRDISPPSAEQDYILADASARDVSVRPQWLDGIALSPGRVKQFVAVPFGSGESVEAQKTGKDSTGGIQLEIIPSLPLSRLRRHLGQQITIYTASLGANIYAPVQLDAGALVWDYVYALEIQEGIPMDQVRCIFRGKHLEPFGRLSHYDITDQSTIHVILKLRGGGGSEPPVPKRMAIGAGGAISQNIKRDFQDPAIWDPSRAIRLNIQILNSLAFEEVTGLIAPPTPINFNTYRSLGIPFFQYYVEDAQAVSGDFGGVLSVDSYTSNTTTSITAYDQSWTKTDQNWTKTPHRCAKCERWPPYRL